MAIDSEVKRKSAAACGNVCMPVALVPNGTIDNPDRQAAGWSYAGISAGGGGGGGATGGIYPKWRRNGRRG